MTEQLSTIDVRILEQVQRDSTLSTSELAEKVGLSQSPCWRRLQKLKEDGYIRGEVALVDRSKLGPSLVIFATLKTSAITGDMRAEFLRKIETIPEVLECYSVFGERDLLMKVMAQSMEWYHNFVFNIIMKLPGVVDIQSTVTMAEMKYTTALPVRGSRLL